ncbi:MAG TPA: DUF3592 domain-containing protein [Candidatus Acidoferrum sp.]|jgi:hypothetical protein|nr:DUF3592 domain-containing protein [Candidatus Acidoferrum sp.]
MASNLNPDVLIVIGPLGLLPFIFGVWQLYRELSPRNWSYADGEIISVDVIAANTGKGGKEYIPTVEYKYQYNNKNYRSTQRRIGNYISGQRESAEAIRYKYPVGSGTTVFVNPKKPEDAVLEYGVTPLSWIFIGIGLLFLIASICIFFGK